MLIEISEKILSRRVRRRLAASEMSFDLTFAVLPILLPEPRLIRADRQCRTQLENTVGTFGDLHLRTRLIEMHARTKLCRQRDNAAPLHA